MQDAVTWGRKNEESRDDRSAFGHPYSSRFYVEVGASFLIGVYEGECVERLRVMEHPGVFASACESKRIMSQIGW